MTPLPSPIPRSISNAAARALALACLWLLVFCASAVAGNGTQAESAPVSPDTYRLGPGDRIQVDVFNHDDLSGQFVLDGSGRFSLPLIGPVDASGLTAAELEEVLVSRLKPDYLVNPRLSVSINFYRPYYLMGEVGRTGSFAYVEGMTYLQAIAIAGGYSYRAKKDVVFVIRADDASGQEIRLDVSEKVQPGDIIRVAERLF